MMLIVYNHPIPMGQGLVLVHPLAACIVYSSKIVHWLILIDIFLDLFGLCLTRRDVRIACTRLLISK
jgi:hypothetical protein